MEPARILGTIGGVDLKKAPLHQLVVHNPRAEPQQMSAICTTQNELDGKVRHTSDQYADDE
jgi:hypothetical protein